ncbi:MAG: hypothetical protein ACJ735_06430 [Actinomycetes bacterium]
MLSPRELVIARLRRSDVVFVQRLAVVAAPFAAAIADAYPDACGGGQEARQAREEHDSVHA